MQYTVMIHRQPPGHYVAHAPAVPNCRDEGRTRNEARHRLKTAMEEWLIETEITTLEINTNSFATPAVAGHSRHLCRRSHGRADAAGDLGRT